MIAVMIAVSAGVVSWTLLEWVIHNLIGHVPKGKHRLSREHLDHHRDPSYFTSAPKKLLAAAPVLTVLGLAVGFAFASWTIGIAYPAGVGAGWLAYEVVHRWIHVRAPANAYGRWARRHHLHHHFHSPRKNHGVTSPFWDLLFGTYEPVHVVSVPRKHAKKLPWLVRDDGGELSIDPRYGADYRMV
jgi:sterol desaturase/sphingolipid hydroxylase (fatty acid hydroxylase superfamily)